MLDMACPVQPAPADARWRGSHERREEKTDPAPEEAASPLGSHLRKLRKARGWSQAELAERIDAHLTHVSRVETGKYSPRLDSVVKAARALGVTVDELVSEREEGFQEIRLEDKDLTERLRLLESLDEHEKSALLTVIDAVLTKKKMFDLLQGERGAA
jgi:transcriptional regulator with XRE-family HTH domain